jgi:hypothetical protein
MRIIRREVVTRTMHAFRGGCCAGHHYTKQILLWEHLNVEEENGARLVVPVHDIAWRPPCGAGRLVVVWPAAVRVFVLLPLLPLLPMFQCRCASTFQTSFDDLAVAQRDFAVVQRD